MLSKKLTAIRVCLALCFSFLFLNIYAQSRTVIGTVRSSDNNGQNISAPIIGATVSVKGTSTSTQTDGDGNFTISVTSGYNVLTITSVGYATQDVNITGRSTITITLNSSNSTLNEVVVTGYTSQRKKDITGSVSVVNVKDMKAIPTGSAEQALQGQASGVTVVTSGAPGGPSNIFVRGISSFGNADPLVIVDGIQSSLHDLNVNDIESIQVLKDAGAASQYGVRGANGVVVVTTKKGSRGKTIINYDGYIGVQQPIGGNPFHILSTQEMAQAYWIAYTNSGDVGANGYPNSQLYGNGAAPVIPKYITPGTGYGVTNPDMSLYNVDYTKGGIHQITAANQQGTDWFHTIFRPAPIQSHTLSMSGGSDKSSFLFSLGYFNQEGTLVYTYLKRYEVRMNSTFNVGDRIRVGENAYVFYKQNPQISYFGENIINYDYREQPIIPVFDVKGNYAGSNGPELGNSSNPFADQQRTAFNRGNTWDMIGNLWAEADIVKHLTARTSFGGTVDNNYYYQYGFHTFENLENNGSNSFNENSYYNSNYTWTNSLRYSNIIAQKHSLTVFGAYEAINYYGRGVGGNRLGYFNDNPSLQVLSAGGPTGQTNYSYAYQSSLVSLIGKIDYAFNERYLLSATVRRDGSSVFGSASRYGTFPAFALGWRVSQENFMKDVVWLNDLKLRGSWGKLGQNVNVPAVNAFTQYASTPGNSNYDIGGTSSSTQQGFYLSYLGNKYTGWEADKITNIGFDATIMHNKIDLSVEYFKKSVQGLLFGDQPLSDVGLSAQPPYVNIGDLSNHGVDGSINYHGASGHDLRFNVGVNISTYKSLIGNIPGSYFDAGGTRIGNFVRNQSGQEVSAFYGYQVIGIFQNAAQVAKSPTQQDAAPGRFIYLDANHSGSITDSDRVFLGSPNPKFTYGLNINASYKNFDVTMIFYGSQGNKAINYTRYWVDFYASFQGAKSTDLLYNSWSPSRPNATVPILENRATFSTNSVPNSYYLEDASFFKCKSLIIGYTLPNRSMQRAGINRFRIYVQASNLFTLTKYTGLDPEIPGGGPSAFGIDYGNYPNNQKMFIAGVNLSF